jgi:hypothetical protein
MLIHRAAGRPQNAADEEDCKTANDNQFHKDGSVLGEVGSGGLRIPEKAAGGLRPGAGIEFRIHLRSYSKSRLQFRTSDDATKRSMEIGFLASAGLSCQSVFSSPSADQISAERSPRNVRR